MRIAFFVVLGACGVVAAADGCGGTDGFTFDQDSGFEPDGSTTSSGSGSSGGTSSGSSGGGSSSGGSSSDGSTCPTTCTAHAECQVAACGRPAGSGIFCCDLATSPGLCYTSASGTCPTSPGDATVPPMDATAPKDATAPMDATMPPCTGRASCGGNQVCCLAGGNRTCQQARNCTGMQVCAGATDCTAPQVCGPAGAGGIRTCQNPPADAMSPVDAAGDGAPRDAAREAAPDDAQPAMDAPTDAPPLDAAPDGTAPVDASTDSGDGSPADSAPVDTGAGG